ncbi:MAG: glycosyltransferase family 4 protein, partial [Dehalococcoidia bacterium]
VGAGWMGGMGRRAVLFVPRKYPPSRGGMEEFSSRLLVGFPGASYRVVLRGSQWGLPLLVARGLATAMRHRGRIGVVHLGDGLLAMFAPLFRAAAGAPVSVTLHGREVERDRLAYRALVRRGLRYVDGPLIAVSAYTAGRARELFGVSAVVVHNGVDTVRFTDGPRATDAAGARARLGLTPEAKVVVTVGRLERRKGVAWFIGHVLPGLPSDVVYLVAGDGPHREAVAEAAAGDARVRLLGLCSDEAIEDLYACADLFVAPNIRVPRDPEGYGIAPAEAAAAGAPVLVADLQGLSDAAAECGVPAVAPEDVDAWVSAVRRALDEPRWAVAQRPPRTWAAVAADYARLFETLTDVERRDRARWASPKT